MGDIIATFWAAMGTNDFDHVSQLLHPDFEYYMPQSREYFRGRETFAKLNTSYPAQGRWVFDVHSILEAPDRGVSDVSVTDGQMQARAVTFHDFKDGMIWRQVEHWPDPFDAPAWRQGLTQIVDKAPF